VNLTNEFRSEQVQCDGTNGHRDDGDCEQQLSIHGPQRSEARLNGP